MLGATLMVLALLAPDGPSEDVARRFEEQRAEALAADVICGEAGLKDEYLASMVAAVIVNRMGDLPGRRAEKTLRVLGKKHQFNGSCDVHGKEPTAWHLGLARIIVRGEHRQIHRPRWLTADVKFFSEARTAKKWLKRMTLAGKHGGMWFFKAKRRS